MQIMTTQQLITLADRELDSRNLAQPQIRKKAVRRVVEYMETTGSFLKGNQLALPSDKKILEKKFTMYHPKTVYGLSGAINVIYQVAGCSLRSNERQKPTSEFFFTADKDNLISVTAEVKEAVNDLINGEFVAVSNLTNNSVPDIPGLYCIKLRKGVVLPERYGEVREDGIIYIGLATKSLHQRFWKQELNHIGKATFFRGIGAVLGYLPPKGSLLGKKNKNYKFSEEDTESIRRWNRQSLLVKWIPMDAAILVKVEKKLIETYQPLMNTTHNPNPSKELAAARERCRQYAQSK